MAVLKTYLKVLILNYFLTDNGSQTPISDMLAIFPVFPLTPYCNPPVSLCFALSSVKILTVSAPQLAERVLGMISKA